MPVKSRDRYQKYSLNDKSDFASLLDESAGGSQVQSIPRICMSIKSRDSYCEDNLYYKFDSASFSDESEGGSHVQSIPRIITDDTEETMMLALKTGKLTRLYGSSEKRKRNCVSLVAL